MITKTTDSAIDTTANDGRNNSCKLPILANDISQQRHYLTHKNDVMTKKKAVKSDTKIDPYERANQRIIDLLETGTVAWRRTWGQYGLAKNFATGHVYTGINNFFMNFLSPHPIPYYLSFKQAHKLGGKVKKGSKAEWVYFYKSYYKDKNGKPLSAQQVESAEFKNTPVNEIRFLKCYPVFNIESIEGIDWERPTEVNRPNNPIEECECILREMPEQPRFESVDADKAFYDPVQDLINLPDLKQFENSEFFYRTTFHEVGHWTGHETRLARSGVVEKIETGSERYAEEELIAELTSNYLLSIAGVQSDGAMEVSAGYLKSWLKRLKADPRFLFRVAPKAIRATEFILGKKLAELPLANV